MLAKNNSGGQWAQMGACHVGEGTPNVTRVRRAHRRHRVCGRKEARYDVELEARLSHVGWGKANMTQLVEGMGRSLWRKGDGRKSRWGCGHGIGMRLEILKHGLGEQGDRVDVTLNVTWVYG
ncbi:hypothetical protein PIB30_084426 [Stylosanthes scabra]|uniref:Uncharacterized protein n=1 Tax=Stylosanthes scabra TaxID=79078 RepID=A0ABU6XQE0_9FABA|nr:hypothetical protein [Stylosanthes scabra]